MKLSDGNNWMRESCPGLTRGLKAMSLLLMVFVAMSFSSTVLAQGFHGITFSKGCVSPTAIGSPYLCRYVIANAGGDTGDGTGTVDTLQFFSLSDIVHAEPADVPTGDILPSLFLTATAGTPSCTPAGLPGAGNTSCTLPPGSAIESNFFSTYSPDLSDPDPLSDTATLLWLDTCDTDANNCPIGNQITTSGSQSTLTCATDCDDSNVCTTDSCNEETNECVNTPGAQGDCDDSDVCTTDSCDPIAGCVNTPGAQGDCDDSDVCTTDSCDPVAGCVNTPGAQGDCDDSDVCTTDSCDPVAGCVNTPGAQGDCDDSDVCTTDSCDPIAGCVNTPGAQGDCDDSDVCTTDSCDPIAGCVNTPGAQGDCDDSDVCTTDSCDPIAGCVNTPGAQGDCDDSDVCTTDSCDPVAGCVNTPGAQGDCDDSDVCTTDSCDPIAGCVNTPGAQGDCDDSDVCTTDSCDPIAGCVNTPGAQGDCDDSDVCTTDSCDPVAGCVNVPGALGDCDDSDVCTTDSCDPVDGCVNTPGAQGDCDDSDVCTTDSCDPVAGCVNTPGAQGDCDDSDICTIDSCDPIDGCVNMIIPEGEADPSCYPEAICRTPGFWGARGGLEKGGDNITEYFVGGGFEVCGVPITNTNLNDPNSAIEAICIKQSSEGDRKFFRDMTSAMLNCNTSTCSAELLGRIAECNSLCEAGLDYGTCAGEMDCYNNGDTWDYDAGMCIENFGACFVSGEDCSDDVPCEGDDYCEPDLTCHDRVLCPEGGDYCFEPPGPASSSGKCNKARKNSLYIGE